MPTYHNTRAVLRNDRTPRPNDDVTLTSLCLQQSPMPIDDIAVVHRRRTSRAGSAH